MIGEFSLTYVEVKFLTLTIVKKKNNIIRIPSTRMTFYCLFDHKILTIFSYEPLLLVF